MKLPPSQTFKQLGWVFPRSQWMNRFLFLWIFTLSFWITDFSVFKNLFSYAFLHRSLIVFMILGYPIFFFVYCLNAVFFPPMLKLTPYGFEYAYFSKNYHFNWSEIKIIRKTHREMGDYILCELNESSDLFDDFNGAFTVKMKFEHKTSKIVNVMNQYRRFAEKADQITS